MSKLLILAAVVAAVVLFSSQAVEEVAAESRGINICGCPLFPTICHARCIREVTGNWTEGRCQRTGLFGIAYCQCRNNQTLLTGVPLVECV
ncbi:hypothetical protein BV898_00369 [Hypsibius exemplaris]|uniref:Invertebrate defensins family profile domain-containing protein n=1 Tax=Hypsibius exemplaris TaxID=2072580 RepID=A0A1W0XFX1_HYPEX|nr:hypothetical protein BV898_00369 [Hypsibius exemplaris]